jgi:hypothetical protein
MQSKRPKKLLIPSLRKAQKELYNARVAAHRTNRERRKLADKFQNQYLGIILPEHLLPIRDPSKEPTKAELDALLPNLSL